MLDKRIEMEVVVQELIAGNTCYTSTMRPEAWATKAIETV